jgi:DNA-directed RNA polymerase specialized sigma24 family protein
MQRRNFTPDQILIDQLLNDNTLAFEELTRRYCFSLYKYCVGKLNSPEDAKRLVRNIFISLWENRYYLPADFSISVHLYSEVRKAVIQCINVKLNNNKDVDSIEAMVIPGFSVMQLQKAKQPIQHNFIQVSERSSIVSNRRYEKQRWHKYPFEKIQHTLKGMLNF